MSDHKQLIRMANIGLNSDDDLTLLQEDSRYIKNIIFNEDGESFVASNVLGNTLKNTLGFDYGAGLTFTLPAGTNTTKFVLENKEENASIIFVYNSTGKHSIYQYYKNTETILWILKGDMSTIGSILNFQSTKQIDAVLIGNQDDKYLIWTDGYNPPRIINIKRAIDLTKGLTTGYTTITTDTISFYKKPPIISSIAFDFSPSGDREFLLKKVYQVAIRKKYNDGTYSVLSSFSEINIIPTEHNPNGILYDSIAYNTIRVEFEVESSDDVLKYELCYRIVDVEDGINGFWYLSDIIPNFGTSSGIPFGYFAITGDLLGVQLSEADTSRIYDYVPDLADHIAIIDSNRVVLGGITEGYDNITNINVVLEHSYDDTTLDSFDEDIQGHIIYGTGAVPLTGIQDNTPYGNNTPYFDPYLAIPSAAYIGFKVTNTTKGVSGTITGVLPDISAYTCVRDNGANFDWDIGDGYSIDTEFYYFKITNTPGRSFLFTKSVSEKTLVRTGAPTTTTDVVSWDYFPGTASEIATYVASRAIVGFTISAAGDYVIFNNTSATDFYINYYAVGFHIKKPSFLSGSKHTFALQYLKDGKPFYATSNKSSDFIVQIPTIAEAIADDGSKNRELRRYINNVSWQILHEPPSEATHFQWLYLGSDISTYREFIIDILSLFPFNETYTKIPIANISNFGDAYNVFDYAIEVLKGDRIRFIGLLNPDESNAIYNNVVSFTNDYDFDIINVDDTYIYIRNIGGYSNDMFNSVAYFNGSALYVIVRIYRPKPLDDQSGIYQAAGKVYNIKTNQYGSYHEVDAGDNDQILDVHQDYVSSVNVHDHSLTPKGLTSDELIGRSIVNRTTGVIGVITGNTSNWIYTTMVGGALWQIGDVYSVSSLGKFNPYFAGCFVQKAAFINANNVFVDYLTATNVNSVIGYAWTEMESVSILYPSLIKNFGRQNIINESAKKQFYNKIRWGGLWFDNSGVSYFNKFETEDSRMLNDSNGVITKMDQRGNTLKVYQETKATSFYLGATSSTDANGDNTFVFSGDVMSVGRQDLTDYGCTNFASYGKNVSNAYFFDIIHGVAIRDVGNGLTSVNFKSSTYFKNKAKEILDYGKDNVLIVGGFDSHTDQYFLSFIVPANLSHAINDTVSFDETNNKWRSHFSFLPEYYGSISGDIMVTFKNGYLYTHYSNSLRNNFFGAQYSSEIWVHSADMSVLSRIFDGIEITSTSQWSCPTEGDVFVTYPIEMESRLVAGNFRESEGIYRASFLRDMLSGGVATIKNLFNGRRLRGHEITCKLKNSDTTHAAIRTVIINSSISK